MIDALETGTSRFFGIKNMAILIPKNINALMHWRLARAVFFGIKNIAI